MKRFDFLIKALLCVASLQLLLRLAICAIEQVTLRNSVGVLVYGLFTDLFVTCLGCLPLLVYCGLPLRGRRWSTWGGIAAAMVFLLVANLQCLMLTVNFFSWWGLHEGIQFVRKVGGGALWTSFTVGGDVALPVVMAVLFFTAIVGLNILWGRLFKHHYVAATPLPPRYLAMAILGVVFFSGVTKLGVNTIDFPKPKAYEAYHIRENGLVLSIWGKRAVPKRYRKKSR